MTLAQIAGLADLVAALGVMATLFFVGYELRRSTNETKWANWRELLDSFRQFKAVTNDLAFSDLIERGHANYHALTAAEKRSFGQYLEQGIHVMGNFSKHAGTVPSQLAGLDGAIRASMSDHLTSPGARQWYEEYKPKGKLMPATYVTIDAILAGTENPAEAAR